MRVCVSLASVYASQVIEEVVECREGAGGSGDGGGSREAGRARDTPLIKERHRCVPLFGGETRVTRVWRPT